ncbi:MAG: ATPase, T2SS/T4P/T4SS family [Desulfobacteraceae bacterium]|nr:ATPase, T2SS/T4P/T4SS family [Desulfobacteraceae bacterium]
MKKRIGDILMEMGFIDGDQLKLALMESKKTGQMLGDVLQRLGWVTEEDLQMAIAVQSGAKILDTENVEIDQSLITRVPLEFVNDTGMFPFAVNNGALQAATNNPFDVIARDKLARLVGQRVETFIAPKKWIAKAIEVYYKTAQTLDDEINTLTYSQAAGDTTEDNRIIKLSSLLIDKGYVVGASDIHVVPDANLVRVYYRIDGVLHQMYLFAKKFQQPLITRYKIMADMDISNPNIPHDGRIKYQSNVGAFDIRVSTFPTQLGETVVMRLLIYSKVVGDLKNLGLEEDDLKRFERTIHRPYGLILTTGPTGSGKTTTLYTALMAINSPSINCMTVEDPIEYVIPTIRQTAVNVKAGLTFENALRSAMREDPDVILVGEIRDKITADLAMRAALTGHLVLSTLHTNDAASAINRLLDLGINASILASALSMIVAQRLVRLLCPNCAAREPITEEERALFVRNGMEPPTEMAKPKGCDSCFQSGYRGRAGIYEVIIVDRNIEKMIFAGALHREIEDTATAAGTVLMFRQALKKVARHLTSLEEITRVIVNYA